MKDSMIYLLDFNENILWNSLGTPKLELILIRTFITLCTFTYLQLDQERQVGDFSVVPTASSMTFFIGSKGAKRKIQKQNYLVKGAFTYDVRCFFGHFWPTYLPKNLTSYVNAP